MRRIKLKVSLPLNFIRSAAIEAKRYSRPSPPTLRHLARSGVPSSHAQPGRSSTGNNTLLQAFAAATSEMLYRLAKLDIDFRTLLSTKVQGRRVPVPKRR
jgi:hypothetical protein